MPQAERDQDSEGSTSHAEQERLHKRLERLRWRLRQNTPSTEALEVPAGVPGLGFRQVVDKENIQNGHSRVMAPQRHSAANLPCNAGRKSAVKHAQRRLAFDFSPAPRRVAFAEVEIAARNCLRVLRYVHAIVRLVYAAAG